MTTFHIENFGCRATFADAAAIERQFLARGYHPADHGGAADVVVLNTCTVTADADATARQAVRRAHRANPAAQIVVTGCYAQRAPEELAAISGVAHVIGNSHLTEIADLVGQTSKSVPFAGASGNNLVRISVSEDWAAAAFKADGQAWTPVPHDRTPVGQTSGLPRGGRRPPKGSVLHPTAIPAPANAKQNGQAWTPVLQDRTRPVLKIQDGCDQRCAYCVIPFVRGHSRSLPPAQVVAEVRRLAGAGAKEIVLSGINIGSYGRDLQPRADLIDLLRRVLDETSLERLRLSSIEPMDVTRDLVELFASSPRLAHHFHIPLQSGSDRILRAMHRWYKAAHYAERVKLVRELLPGAGIGADVIAGFPGETDADHRATLDLVESLPFSYLHVFGFSPRPGTEAARLMEQERVPQVPPAVIKRRVRELRALAAKKAAAFRAAHAGQSLRALTLHRQGASASGPWTAALADNYLSLRIPGLHPANEWHMSSMENGN